MDVWNPLKPMSPYIYHMLSLQMTWWFSLKLVWWLQGILIISLNASHTSLSSSSMLVKANFSSAMLLTKLLSPKALVFLLWTYLSDTSASLYLLEDSPKVYAHPSSIRLRVILIPRKVIYYPWSIEWILLYLLYPLTPYTGLAPSPFQRRQLTILIIFVITLFGGTLKVPRRCIELHGRIFVNPKIKEA